MTLYLEDDYQFFENNEGLLEKVKAVIEGALDLEKVPYEPEISLTVADKEGIRDRKSVV